MSDTAIDSVRLLDEDMATGLLALTLQASFELHVPRGDHDNINALDQAAQSGQTAFDNAVNAISCFNGSVRAQYNSLGTPVRNALRKAALKR